MADLGGSLPEARPLLDSDEGGESESIKNPTPLPWLQLSTVYTVDISVALSLHFMAPFITEQISKLDLVRGDPRRVGYYVGLLTTCRNVAATLSVFPFSWLSDRIGRKPPILFGMFTTTAAVLCFGLSRTFLGLVVSLCFGHLLSSNTTLTKLVVIDITDSTNQASGLSRIITVASLGASLSALIGGCLANPSDRFPGVFTSQFWKQYPYFLPSLVIAISILLCISIVLFTLKETLPSRSGRSRNFEQSSPVLPAYMETHLAKIWETVTYPVIIATANSSMFGILFVAQGTILPLFLASPGHIGGINFNPAQIGSILGIYRACSAIFLVGCCPRIVQHFGARRSYSIAVLCSIVMFMLFPIANLFVRAGNTFGVWACVTLLGLMTACLEMGVVCIYVFVAAAAPSQDSMGTTNGIAITVSTIAGTPCPAVATALWSLSLERNLLGGYFVYVVFLVASIFALWLTLKLPTDTRPIWEIERRAEEL